jgi:hypothetical protein
MLKALLRSINDRLQLVKKAEAVRASNRPTNASQERYLSSVTRSLSSYLTKLGGTKQGITVPIAVPRFGG